MLGDRIRMGAHGAHAERVFIRSFASRGELGGLSRATRAAVDCFDACRLRPRHRRDRRHRPVGDARSSRSPTRASSSARPGLGDDVQAIKAGMLEIADVLVVSKGDLPLAEQTAREMREMLALRRRAADAAWQPRVVVVSAQAGSGIDELLARSMRTAHAGTGRPMRTIGATQPARHRPSRPTPDASMPPHGAARSTPTRWRRRASPALARRATASAATLGIAFRAGGPGRAEVAMTVDARHLNFNGGCHGGAIFALADTAFGLASNSHGPVAVGHRRPHHVPGRGRRRRHAGRARDRDPAQPPHRRLPDRRRARRRRAAARPRSRASPARSTSRPDRARAPAAGIHRRVLSRRLSSERQHGVKIFLKSAWTRSAGAVPTRRRSIPCTPPSPACCSTTPPRRPAAPALREKEFGIWQTLTWSALAALVEALAVRPRRSGPGARPAPGRHRREPAAPLRGDAGGAVARRDPGAALPGRRRGRVRRSRSRNADVAFAIVEDQEQVDKLLEVRDRCPQLDADLVRRPARPAQLPRAGPGVARRAGRRRAGALRAAQPGFFAAEVGKAKPDDVAAMFFTSGTTGNAKGVVHTPRDADRPRRAPARASTS